MGSLQQWSTRIAADEWPVHWHFRALPNDVQRGTIRRLALCGLDEREIAARTGLSVDSVRCTLVDDDCLRNLPTPSRSHRKVMRRVARQPM
jgi:hypothetical protein